MFKSIALEVSAAVLEDKFIYRVMVQKEQISEWCLLLTLLRFGCIETAIIVSNEGNLSIQKAKKIANKKKSAARSWYGKVVKGDTNLILFIAEDVIDNFLDFYLRFYRDSAATVDHIDYEATNVEERLGFNRFYLTLKVPYNNA